MVQEKMLDQQKNDEHGEGDRAAVVNHLPQSAAWLPRVLRRGVFLKK